MIAKLRLGELALSDHAFRALTSEQMAPLRYVRRGSPVSADDIIGNESVFVEHMRLPAAPTPALKSLAARMGLPMWGPRWVVYTRLLRHFNHIIRDSALIHAEGMHALSQDELIVAARERGLRIEGLTEAHIVAAIREFNKLAAHSPALVSSLLLFAHGNCITELWLAPSTRL